mgnify:CR=1 FL=1
MSSINLNEIILLKSNKHYRLADLIFCQGLRAHYDRQIILSDSKYKDSFLKYYLDENFRINPDFEELNSIFLKKSILEFSKNIKTCDDNLYLNIRLGDVVMDEYNNINTVYSHGVINNTFIFNEAKIIRLISKKIKLNPFIKSISFVMALHFGNNDIYGLWGFNQEALDENFKRLNSILKKIEEKFNLPISLLLPSGNSIKVIDNHFITLCTAKNVIIDGSGFGDLITKSRQILKNNL